jgi:hypothetical protein
VEGLLGRARLLTLVGVGGSGKTRLALRSMLPLILKLGIATEEEVEIDTMAQRLRADVVASGGVIKTPELVGAWTAKR